MKIFFPFSFFFFLNNKTCIRNDFENPLTLKTTLKINIENKFKNQQCNVAYRHNIFIARDIFGQQTFPCIFSRSSVHHAQKANFAG